MAPPVTVPSARTRAVLHRQRDFGELGAHAEKAGEHHPQRWRRARPSVTATATPPMRAEPTVPDTAVDSAWNGVASPGWNLARVVAADDPRRVTEASQIHETECQRADDAAHDEPHHDERQFRSGEGYRVENDVAEPVGNRREPRIDSLVDGHDAVRIKCSAVYGRGVVCACANRQCRPSWISRRLRLRTLRQLTGRRITALAGGERQPDQGRTRTGDAHGTNDSSCDRIRAHRNSSWQGQSSRALPHASSRPRAHPTAHCGACRARWRPRGQFTRRGTRSRTKQLEVSSRSWQRADHRATGRRGARSPVGRGGARLAGGRRPRRKPRSVRISFLGSREAREWSVSS